MTKSIAAPPVWMTALESRAVVERATLALAAPLRRLLPSGDHHQVLVLPGFMADDRSTQPLRAMLDDIGYRSHGWNLGSNLGPTAEILDGMGELLESLQRQGDGPVSIVGWSLGGIYARELARAEPNGVRQVITLGSPIQMIEQDTSAAQGLWNALQHLHSSDFKRETRAAFRPLLDVPTTSIYSRMDGIVNWRASLTRRTASSENIRVYGSHCGLGFNASVIYAIADRLAQPEGEWRPFRAPLFLRGSFPRAQDFDLEHF